MPSAREAMPEKTEFAGCVVMIVREYPATGKWNSAYPNGRARIRSAVTAGGKGQLTRNIFPSAGIWISVSITGRPAMDSIALAYPRIWPMYLSLM